MLAALLFLLAATAADQFIRYSLERDNYQELQRTSLNWASRYREGTLPARIPTEESDPSIVQVVNVGGEVLGTSESDPGRPLSTLRPPLGNRVENFIQCRTENDCLMISAVRAEAAENSVVVYTARSAPALLTGHTLEYTLLLLCLPLLALFSWVTWVMTGRTLRPVEEIRARIAEITASDLGLRVPVPTSSREFAALATTSNDTLSRLEKSVEEQRRFASDVAHELRNPIAGLSLQLEEALMDREDTDPWPVIESSLTAAERLSAIVDDLLTIARLQSRSPKMEPIDLGDLATARALNYPQIRVEAEPGVLVEGSRIRLTRLLANLLNNAVRHADSRVEVEVRREGDLALLAVTDDGAGVAEADREKIFERFVRLEESKERDPGGTGLGLSISREIAEEHGGSLVLADSDRGARFELRLPLLRASDPAEREADHPSRE